MKTNGGPMAHFTMVIILAFSSLLLLALGGCSAPFTSKHKLLCLPAAFSFPAPLLAPPLAKVSCVSSLVHYVIRMFETAAILTAISCLCRQSEMDPWELLGLPAFAEVAILVAWA